MSLRTIGRDFLHVHPSLARVYRALKTLKVEGFHAFCVKLKRYLRQAFKKHWAYYHVVSDKEQSEQRSRKFAQDIKFSILVPLYNTPEKFLRDMIDSVQKQTYANWELCLCDASDCDHDEVETICRDYIAKDARIRYQRIENLSIPENSNACLELATGDYLALLDHDDLLHMSALYYMADEIEKTQADFLYTDEMVFAKKLSKVRAVHAKPDFSPDTLRAFNYITHLLCCSRELMEQVGGFRKECNGSQDYDLALRMTEAAKRIVHIQRVLYFWRAHSGSVAQGIEAKPYTLDAAKRALTDHLDRVGLKGTVEDGLAPSSYRIRYELNDEPLISILIPNKDQVQTLDVCVQSILRLSTYLNYEIVIVENNSTDKETFAYYEKLQVEHKNIHVKKFSGDFNYSRINNFGSLFCQGEYLLLLNNDIEVITPDWMEQMLMLCQREDVGAVGAKLYFPNDIVQHAGVVIGIGGFAGHVNKLSRREDHGYLFRLCTVQNLSACTAACLMVKHSVFREIKGFDESFAVALNDVDLCLRIRQIGKLIIFTPFAELYHHESISRGLEDTPEKIVRFEGEVAHFKERWHDFLEAGDPYYSPLLSLERHDCALK